ncbi:VOC family protein [Dyadobacter sp. 3J3]|uniref:VOC family protein n=1 Tax=Dyadobacter sp. 3J3 TaxID=2606600 RepID=UPI0013572BFD|nr:VOC family protein [Dyadobacter sp. 3J3]
MKIGMAGIFVNDPKEAFKFYTEILGFQEKLFMPEENLAIVVSPEDPNGTTLLLEPTDNPIGKTYQEALYQSNIPAIVFAPNDIHEEYERLKNLGVVFKKEPETTEWGTMAIFDDTCGNLIQLFNP